jgi:hypothetical protein
MRGGYPNERVFGLASVQGCVRELVQRRLALDKSLSIRLVTAPELRYVHGPGSKGRKARGMAYGDDVKNIIFLGNRFFSAARHPSPKEENSMIQLPWVLAAMLAIMIVEIVIAFALECVRADRLTNCQPAVIRRLGTSPQ